jgi:hypothetical protein
MRRGPPRRRVVEPGMMVADAVTIEPVSKNNRVKYRETANFRPETAPTALLSAVTIGVFSDLPCKK